MLSQTKTAVHKQAAIGPPSYFNSTGGISKGIVNLNSAFENLLEQKYIGCQYDKNEQLTLLIQCKLSFTGRKMLTAL
jgi:hypothetical protein